MSTTIIESLHQYTQDQNIAKHIARLVPYLSSQEIKALREIMFDRQCSLDTELKKSLIGSK